MATGYSVANGQIITPAGTPFIARGVDVYDMQMDYAGQILTLFPHINFVRLACTNAGSGNYSANAAADLEPFITTMTGAGVVVEIENHNDQQTVLTGSALAAESAWYASLAAAFIGNPLVWFGTMNEPMDTGTDGGAVVSAQHVATYEAIRGTGNETIIMLMLIAGYGPVFNGTLTSSVYETMTNVVWDQHFYNWITQDSTDSATIAAALASFIKADQALTSANGIMPVIIGEYGPSTNGSTEDAGGMTLVSVVQQSGYGCAAWDMCYPGQTNADDLVVQSTPLTLTAYGTAVAGFIAAGAAVTPTPTPTPTPAPTPTPTPTSTPTKVVAPLTGTVTAGTWQTLQMALAGGPSGQPMQYNLLMPAQYNPDILYPLFVFGHPLDNGMNGSSYPKPGSQFVTDQAYGPGLSLDSVFNDPAWRTEFPCIVIAPQCDETIDPSGANPNSNFGGYADSQNSGWNEQAVNLIVQHALATLPVDPTRCYGYGTSLGAIGVLAWLVDNNQINGPGLKLWTAGVGLSDQLYRPTVPNDATLFARMADVPYLAVSTPSDNVPSSYDQPAWQYYTGNSNYPTQADYDAGGVAAIRAGTSQFYYIAEPSGSPWNTLLALNANGGDGTALYQWLFAQTASGAVTVPTPTPTPVPTPTPTPTAPAPAFVTAGTTESFTDSGGAVWTLSAAGVALKNGAAVAGGGGTSMLAYESGVIYGQDAQTGDWFEYANGGWTPATLPVAPPAAPPPPLGSVTPASVQAEIDAVTALLATIRANVGTL